MASSCIREWKNIIMSELQNDDDIIVALDLNDDEDEENLAYTRIFPYEFVPETQEVVKCYILVEIHISPQRNRYNNANFYDHPTIAFRVLAHQDDMRMSLPTLSAVRTDYIAELIDKKYNGRLGFGIGKLQLTSNVAGSLNDTYRYRDLVFESVDVSKYPCA